jgi:hypothetical protein
MQKLSSLFLSELEKKDSWLIIGKGPSYSSEAIDSFPLNRRVGLNHVVEKVSLAYSHVIDLDVVRECGDTIYENAEKLIMPIYPHENFRPVTTHISNLLKDFEVLKQLSIENRLVCYDCATSDIREEGEPLIAVKNFSVEGALNILVYLGVKQIRTTGIDGGKAYNKVFSNLTKKTLLSNGQNSFDSQFEEIAKTLTHNDDVLFGSVGLELPIRVFIGSDKNQYLPAKVLEFSIKSRSSSSVRTMSVDDTDVPVPTDPHNRSKTGFSFGRFKIPSLCAYSGHGIYLDADMLVFRDISALWHERRGDMALQVPIKAPKSHRPQQHSVFLVNCSLARWDVNDFVSSLDAGTLSYDDLMKRMAIVPEERVTYELDYGWNSLEDYDASDTKLLHYTDMPTQPWISYKNPFGYLWYREVQAALASGFITEEEFQRELAEGRIFPGLRAWIFLSKYQVLTRYSLIRQLIDAFSRLLYPNWRAPYRESTLNKENVNSR